MTITLIKTRTNHRVEFLEEPNVDENSVDETSSGNGTGRIARGKHRKERYPDVRSYFRYLLDRVEVTFHRYGHAEEDSFTIPLLFSNVYDEVIEAVASHLGAGTIVVPENTAEKVPAQVLAPTGQDHSRD